MTFKAIPTFAATNSLSTTSAAIAQDYDISWNTIDVGGVQGATGGAFTLSGTIGQTDAGPTPLGMTGGEFTLTMDRSMWKPSSTPARPLRLTG